MWKVYSTEKEVRKVFFVFESMQLAIAGEHREVKGRIDLALNLILHFVYLDFEMNRRALLNDVLPKLVWHSQAESYRRH